MASAARQSAFILLFSAGYFVSILAGHALSIPELKFATFWPSAGFLLAALATTPKRAWPQIVLAASMLNLDHGGVWERQSLPTALIFLTANGLEAVLGGWILQQSARGIFDFSKLRQVLCLAVLALVT